LTWWVNQVSFLSFQKLAIETAERNGVKLILANDPDADRLAVAEWVKEGEWKIFNGNEIGILLADWVWQQHLRTHPEVAKDPSSCLMLTTAVSSQMLRCIAAKEGFRFEETLTGFKWIGSVAEKFIKEGYHFLFGYEEAIGFMVGDICLDKDGIRGIAVFAEMAAQLQLQNLTCNQHLIQIYQKYPLPSSLFFPPPDSFFPPLFFLRYGYYVTCNKYFFCYDPEVMRTIFQRVRRLGEEEGYKGEKYQGKSGSYPSRCGEFGIRGIRDLTTGFDNNQKDNKAILPVSTSTEMITFHFDNDCLLTLRGSGTEPKLKYYAELHGAYQNQEIIRETLHKVVQAVIHHFLRPNENNLEPPRQ
jgi:phosphomannomutase